MALDGIYIHSLIDELKSNLIGSKIDKINQPEKDEIILNIRGKENKKLLISSSSTYPRIHFTTISKNNPLQPPVFCMVLRKYLTSGKIIDVSQVGFDRIIKISVQTTDELGFESIYDLIIEIMSRHSNITLVRARDNKVMESIKHITPNKNSYRVLYPGVDYVYPPASEKLNLSDFSKEDLDNIIKDNDEFTEGFFSKIVTGVGKNLSKDLFVNFNNKYDTFNSSNVFEFLKEVNENIFNEKRHLIFLKDDRIVDFYFKDLKVFEDYKVEEYPNHSELLDNFYSKKDKQDRLHGKSVDLQKLINTNIDRCMKKIKILNNTLEECSKKDIYQIKGELLTSYIYSINKGDKKVSLLNYYNGEEEEYIDIELDVNKTPAENIQKYFKKYNKLKTAEKEATKQLEITKSELEYLNSVATNLDNVDTYEDIEEIKKELIESSYIKFRRNNKKKKDKLSKPMHFLSSDGTDIYVGKNNIQNDYLTLKFAENNYTWLHTKEIPGSHVIIASFNVSDETLLEAATLAAFYSKGAGSTKVPVDYTLVKNVKKPSGAKPGMVIYTTNRTLFIDPPKELTIQRIN
ncbi:Rqc2 family fibronectin-binding protein [Clostridium massiliamazoniense]|uniref:Rqc2 family fibronectin-binding protein n=1 Tax=Clostridium massiliamazoniense TaxID=1347366 RepID=UPI0006D7F558|nr:NFACT RNA binding domain-containing protein [Clostridium massiliamazoniense]